MIIDSYHLMLALVLGFFVGGIAGYLGSLMLTKRMALVGGALGHLALPGVSLALLYHFDVGLGAFLFLFFGIFFIWLLTIVTEFSFEALTGVVFSVSLAFAFLILPKKEFDIALLGDVSGLTLNSVALSCFGALLLFLLVWKIYSKVILMNISKDLAAVGHINLKLVDFIFLFCIGCTVALGVRIVGGLMTAALVTIPAATSTNMTTTLRSYGFLSLLLGSVSCASGILLHAFLNLPVGPLIIISSGLLFFLSLFIRKIR